MNPRINALLELGQTVRQIAEKWNIKIRET